jgi:8-oxo-dGTP pyrophosphatase MutT (NUDIX family)
MPDTVYAHAVLIADGLYVLQHRDNKPGIASPGLWALFGGRAEEGEGASTAVVREIEEELCIRLSDCREIWSTERDGEMVPGSVRYAFFEADISTSWGQHRLMEGQAVDRFSFNDTLTLPMSQVTREAITRHHARDTK